MAIHTPRVSAQPQSGSFQKLLPSHPWNRSSKSVRVQNFTTSILISCPVPLCTFSWSQLCLCCMCSTFILHVFAVTWGMAAVCGHHPLNYEAPLSSFHHLDTSVNSLVGKLLHKLRCLSVCAALEILIPWSQHQTKSMRPRSCFFIPLPAKIFLELPRKGMSWFLQLINRGLAATRCTIY